MSGSWTGCHVLQPQQSVQQRWCCWWWCSTTTLSAAISLSPLQCQHRHHGAPRQVRSGHVRVPLQGVRDRGGFPRPHHGGWWWLAATATPIQRRRRASICKSPRWRGCAPSCRSTGCSCTCRCGWMCTISILSTTAAALLEREDAGRGGGAEVAGAGRRELLERWCFEYKTVSAERFLQAEGIVTNDPMVQLTHVCKRVVVWLRTLYCWTRLLPSKALSASKQVGFSIYVNADGSDDISELTERQNFLSQGPQSRGASSNGVVVTPYGELSWQVLYCHPSKIERLIPVRTPSVRIQVPPSSHSHSASRPIPMPTGARNDSSPSSSSRLSAAHSAPSRDNRVLTYTERSQQKQQEAAKAQQQRQMQAGKSFDPSHLHKRSTPSTSPNLHPHLLQRRHTSIDEQRTPQQSPPRMPSGGENPPRVMSGLSLALMMASNDDDNSGETNNGENHSDGSNNVSPDDSAVVVHNDDGEEETAEETVRRAALHQVPPHLLEPPLSHSPGGVATTPTTGEYGYGYNNHIPWQSINPSNSTPALVRQQSNSFGRTLSCSPGSLTSATTTRAPTPQTPPVPVFAGSTTPVSNALGHLIPPRNRSDSKSSVTPPFQPRPAGFFHEAPSSFHLFEPQQQQPPPPTPTAADTAERSPAAAAKQMTSLDLLRSSPFQQHPQQQLQADDRASMLSSLSFVPGSDISSHMNSAMMHSGTADLRRSLWSGGGGGGLASGSVLPSSLVGSAGYQHHPLDPQQEDFYSEEMPFAVEMSAPSPPTTNKQVASLSKSGASASSSSYPLGNSAALTSLAQKCSAPSHRLKMFDRQVAATAADR